MLHRGSLFLLALATACSSSGERSTERPRPDDGAPPAAVTDAAVLPLGFDRTRLADDVEPCVGTDGAFVRCVGRVVTGNRPKSLAFSPDGKELWVALHYDKPALAVYDTTTFALIGAVEMGAYGAVELAFSRDGARVYASQFETASVFEVDRAARTVTRVLETGSSESKVVEVAPDDKTVWVANWKGNDVSEFDATTGSLRRSIKTPGIPRGLWATPDGAHLYIAGYSPGRLYRVDRASGELTILSEMGSSVRHLVADPTRGRLYASDLGDAEIRVYDLAKGSFEVLARTDPKPNTIDLSPDGRLLFASCRGANNPDSYLDVGPEWGTVLVYDALTGRMVDAVVSGNQSTGLDVSPDGRLVATTDFLDNRVNIYAVPDTSAVLAGDGGASSTYRARVTKKKGQWGAKTPRDPDLWKKLAPSPPAPKRDDQPDQE